MLIILGLLVFGAVFYSGSKLLKGGISGGCAKVTALCTISLLTAFVFTCVMLAAPGPVLKVLHTDMTGAMVVGAVAMGSIGVICICAAVVCLVRRVKGWAASFILLAAACAFQGSLMFYLLFMH